MSQQQINVDLSQAQDIVCENCGNYTFEEVLLMKKLSALLSPTGKETVIPIPTFSCNACGYINKQFLPVSMRGEDPRPSEETEQQKPTLTLEK
jgi:uncharacterized Zn finger protein